MVHKLENEVLKKSKYYYDFVIASIVFAIICIPTAGKIVDLFGIPLSISIFYFPFIYIIADLLTEVYGYALARKAVWYSAIAQLVTVVVFQIVAYAPASVTMQNNESFFNVLSQAPIIVGVGICAMFIGDITNNYVVAKMKIMTSGNYMAGRLVTSTLAGQFVNTFIFYFFALTLTGIIPFNVAINSIILGTLIKTFVEIIMLPLTLYVVKKIKEIENIDVYDKETNFNPLKF